MHIQKADYKKFLILGILIILIISFAGCTGDDGDGDDNGDGNGNGNGNGNGGDNNTTNGDSPITFVEVRQEPDPATFGGDVHIFVRIESDYPIVKVMLTICDDAVCFFTEDMSEGADDEYSKIVQLGDQFKLEKKEQYKSAIKAEDSLGNKYPEKEEYHKLNLA